MLVVLLMVGIPFYVVALACITYKILVRIQVRVTVHH